MLLTIATTHQPASDLGYLVYKHSSRCQWFDLSFGKVHVFYTEVGGERCSACILLDVDPVGMARGKSADFLLAQYVNDWPMLRRRSCPSRLHRSSARPYKAAARTTPNWLNTYSAVGPN